MRHIAWLSLALALGGCGYKTWWLPPFTGNGNPNAPSATSENIDRVQGRPSEPTPITTEPGDIWPGPLAPPPTLQDLEKTGGLTPQPEQPVPGSPISRGAAPPVPPPNPSVGSSTPPGNAQPGLPNLQPNPPTSSNAPPVAAAPRGQTGQVIQTPRGPEVTTGGTSGYRTTTTPGGGQSIIVPNGNGTSTVIHSDGRVETIPTQP